MSNPGEKENAEESPRSEIPSTPSNTTDEAARSVSESLVKLQIYQLALTSESDVQIVFRESTKSEALADW